MSQEQDKAFFKNFTIILIILAVLMATFMILGVMFGGVTEPSEKATAEVMKNTEPVAKMKIEGDAPEAPAAEKPTEIAATGGDDAGKATYDSICVACHGSGIPGIPQLGDTASWAPRIEQGKDTLYEHAIVGYTGSSGMPMPAKGGNPALSDDDVKAAVDYMVGNSQSAAADTGSAESTADTGTESTSAHAGKATYDSICVACHGSGIPGIPQLGDVASWAPRIEQGNDTLYDHAITGYTGSSGMPMPAKGGNPALSDDDVKAAVDYMVVSSQ